MKKVWAQEQDGFTIVELLIVIVVIAVLAAITIVAYNGIQARAYDSKRDMIMRNYKTALQNYYTDNGSYPDVCAGGGDCSVTSLASVLVPKYTSKVEDDPNPSQHWNYIKGSDGYGILVRTYQSRNVGNDYQGPGVCKFGVNVYEGWWGAAACP